MKRLEAIVIGGGQAGLAVSRGLVEMGVDHVVLERGRIGETWRRRWDSFCLVTPNWSAQLPGHPYDGNDPDGFMPRDEIVEYLERYAASVGELGRHGIARSPSNPGSSPRRSASIRGSKRCCILANSRKRDD
jgi:glycine/D-amino acid oxidase-like deaminating enzyme